MEEYINKKVYERVAEQNNVAVGVITAIDKFRNRLLANTIKQDDPGVSVKLDYWGNLFSNPKQRERIEKLIEKNNGRLTEDSR